MLRMGRSPRNEQNEPQTQGQPQAQTQAPSQQFERPAQPAAQPANAQQQQPARPAATTTTSQPHVASSAPPRALSESEALARDIREGVMSGFVGGTTVLNGEADFKGMLRVDGHLTGRVNSEKGTLIVSAGGRVDADITVATAKVNGVVNGDIVATERIELGRSAQVHGNIRTPALIIEQGAVFEGNCRMARLAEVAEKPQQGAAAARTTEAAQSNGRARAERREAPRAVESRAEGQGANAPVSSASPTAKPEEPVLTGAAS